jgi:RNA-binding protein
MTSPTISSIAPVSSRKRALMETGELRRRLRAHGHALKPLVHIGKSGVTPGVLAQLSQALFDHELVKVRIATECPVDRFDVADALADQPGTRVAQLVGRVVLVYKRHPEKPRFEGKASRPADAAEPAKRRPLNRRAAKRRTAKRRESPRREKK